MSEEKIRHSAYRLIVSENYWDSTQFYTDDIDPQDRIELFPIAQYIEKRNSKIYWIIGIVGYVVVSYFIVGIYNWFTSTMELDSIFVGIVMVVLLFLWFSVLDKLMKKITSLEINSILDQCRIERLNQKIKNSKKKK